MWLVVPISALVMRLASEPTANISYLVIAAYALSGRAQVIHALALSWLFSMLNSDLAPVATADSAGRYAAMAMAVVSTLLRSGMLRRSTRATWPVLATALLGLFLIAHSLLFSPMSDVSMLKALSWALTMMALLAAWGGLSEETRAITTRQLFGGLVIIMLVSLPLLVLPAGYVVNGTGFQGILNQPQTFGPAMALLGAWAASRMLGQERPPWRLVLLVGICLVLVVLSEARTAGLALVLGVVIAVLTIPILTKHSIRSVLPGIRNRRVHTVLAMSIAGALLAGPLLADRLGLYLVKHSGADTVAEAFTSSRGALVEEMWANILEHPLRGIGFGIASVPEEMVVVRDAIFNLPISAGIEKGVLPVAVLEELGIIGFLLFLAWVWMLIRRASRGGVAPLALLSTALLLNFGESMLFSPSGFGLLVLIVIAWAATQSKPAIHARGHD